LRVLLVEPDVDTAEDLALALRRHNHDVDSVRTGGEALQAFHRADLVLLDLELPDIDGLEVCRAVRAARDIPIIAVTTRGSELDRVLGLQAGADDYVVKPYWFRELMARIAAVMRRTTRRVCAAEVIERGPLQLDPGRREVLLDGRAVFLTRKEFDLLHLLASRPGVVFSRREVAQRVWEGNCTESSRTIDTHVSSVRTKLGDSSWIVTVRGVGFRFGRGRDQDHDHDRSGARGDQGSHQVCPHCGAPRRHHRLLAAAVALPPMQQDQVG
jgi:DNA-binding response OmpR family regulator